MEITVRKATKDDLDMCLSVEKAAMENHCYLKDVWDYFDSSLGDLICVLADNTIVGIGKLTVLYDGSAWLEALRVDPNYQGKGIGSAIYSEYMKQAKKYNCPSIAMGTNPANEASCALAEKFNLTTTAKVRTYNHNSFKLESFLHDFVHVSCDRAAELIMPHKNEYNKYIVLSGTSFPLNEKTIRGFAADGKVFEDKKTNSYILCGARFKYEDSLFIGLMGGEYDKCIHFAKIYAKAQGIKTISCSFTIENSELENSLRDNGFEKHPYEWIVKELIS